MAINLALKYASKIDRRFTAASFVKGKTSTQYDLMGVKTVRIYTAETVDLADYNRGVSANRYGTPTEIGDTIQELTMTRDRSFARTIDKGNNTEQMMVKRAGEMMRLQIDERVTPEIDKYAFEKMAKYAGTINGVSAPTVETALGMVADAVEVLDDNLVPQDGRYLYVTANMFKLISTGSGWIANERLGGKALEKGVMGEVFGCNVVKVPSSYLPESCYFILAYKGSVLLPIKIQETNLHQDPPGISGHLLEGRFLYDCFILQQKAFGVYACVLSSAQQAAPTITCATPGTSTMTIASSGADEIKYTTDGSDPRYSSSALIYAGAVATTGWSGTTVVKAVAFDSANFTSDVTTASLTVA